MPHQRHQSRTQAGLTPCVTAQENPDLVASLDYGTFQGTYSKQYNISYWRKIPFAAPPTGVNRFRAPQPPRNLTSSGVYNSNKDFDMCPQRTVNGSEDCLYLGLYSRPWKRGQPLRPVVVSFYGGGFIQGSASFTVPPSAYPLLNVSATTDLLFVFPNYRTNAFGFLPGKEIVADPQSDTNPGLLDQRAAIQWANRHAAHFGGDPRNVTIWGQSAGGGSVVAQAIADQNYAGAIGAGPVFQKALASSPYWPKTYEATAPDAQWIYDTLVNRTGCAGKASTLACLKAVDVQAIRDASAYIAAANTYNTSSYTWSPVIDGKFLPRRLSEVTKTNAEFGFSMFNTHEGETFIPGGISSDAKFNNLLAAFLPDLSARDLDAIKQLYPPNGSTETLTSYDTASVRAGLVYRDVVLACPGYFLAGASSGGGWLGEYSISPAKHASDTYWWNRINTAQQTDPAHYKGYAGAMASFFVTGDPNARKLTPPGTPGVPALSSSKEFVVDANGFATAELIQLKKRCEFWRKLGPSIPV
ncbi:putative carboxylesterase [Bombardia bombarda]|uniref:Carboxylic ester hydrolase n=1 Tax=Bombardia bombarda TaxID=252184 RepID=A0AA39WMM2_9PEZI|nr:putative carboxylesterase [Bombardia bombarda]